MTRAAPRLQPPGDGPWAARGSPRAPAGIGEARTHLPPQGPATGTDGRTGERTDRRPTAVSASGAPRRRKCRFPGPPPAPHPPHYRAPPPSGDPNPDSGGGLLTGKRSGEALPDQEAERDSALPGRRAERNGVIDGFS